MEFDDLVRTALKVSGLTQGQFAQQMRVSQGSVSRWLSGKANPEVKHWIAVREFVARYADGDQKVSPDMLPMVPLVGAVGAGAVILPLDNGDSPLEYVEPAFAVPAGTVCVQVRGDSMYPRYFDGELIYYRSEPMNPSSAIGRECVVKLADGRMLIKILRKGSAPGVYRLESWNAPTIEDVVVDYVTPVTFVDRR